LDKALKIEPENTVLLFTKGAILEELKKPEDALRVYNEILDSHPNDKSALRDKAHILEDLGRYSEALAVYEEYLYGISEGKKPT